IFDRDRPTVDDAVFDYLQYMDILRQWYRDLEDKKVIDAAAHAQVDTLIDEVVALAKGATEVMDDGDIKDGTPYAGDLFLERSGTLARKQSFKAARVATPG